MIFRLFLRCSLSDFSHSAGGMFAMPLLGFQGYAFPSRVNETGDPCLPFPLMPSPPTHTGPAKKMS